MDFEKEARAIQEEEPQQISFNPPPLPYVGYINVLRRRDGGYLIAAIGHDDQAGQFDDGTVAAEILDQPSVAGGELEQALERAHDSLMRLRLEGALRLAAKLGRALHDDKTLVTMFRDALASSDNWE